MIGGMGQRRPPTGPSPYTAGRPNPMAQGGGANYAPMATPPMRGPQGPSPWGGSFGTGKLGPMGPQGPMGGAPGPGAQGVGPNYGGYQGTPPWMGGGSQGAGAIPLGQIVPGAGPAWLNDPNLQPQVAYPQGGPQGMSDAMMHPFAPRNRGAQGVGPMQGQIQNSLVGMQGAMGGGAQGVGPNMILPAAQQMQGAMGGGPMQQMRGALGQMQMDALPGGAEPRFQRRFPGALSRGIMQGMAPPPQMAQAAPPAPYGGQQFRMW